MTVPQKQTPQTQTQRQTGRPRAFDASEVIDRSLEVFWQHGFTSTTTSMLEAELGMTQSSIYNAFGSKQELLELVFNRYEERLDQALIAPLVASDSPEALEQFVSGLLEWVGREDQRGCLLLNLAGELGETNPDIVERAANHRSGLRNVFAENSCRRVFPKTSARSRADLLLAGVLG